MRSAIFEIALFIVGTVAVLSWAVSDYDDTYATKHEYELAIHYQAMCHDADFDSDECRKLALMIIENERVYDIARDCLLTADEMRCVTAGVRVSVQRSVTRQCHSYTASSVSQTTSRFNCSLR